MTVYATIDSPLGELLLVGEESATGEGRHRARLALRCPARRARPSSRTAGGATPAAFDGDRQRS